jgi:hypothetical protein
MSTAPTVDYDSLAKQAGGVPPPSSAVDYDALAAQSGGTPADVPIGDQPTSLSGVAQTMWDQAKGAAEGAWKGIKHTVSQIPTPYMNYQTPPPRPDLAPTTTPEKIGYGAEQAAEFLTPQGAEAGAGRMIEAATKLPVARALGRAVIRGLTAGAVAGPQSENNPTAMRNTALAAGGTSAALEAAAPVVSKLANKTATGTYMSALKPSTNLDQSLRAKLFQTAKLEGIPVSEGGLQTASDKIDALQQQVSDAISKAQASGAPGIPTADIASRLQDTRNKFANQFTPTSDLAKIDETETALMGSNPPTMSLPEVQAKKVGTYNILRQKGAYGEQSAAGDESLKAIARGAKEELVARVPELAALNPQEGSLIQLEGALQKAVARIQNVNKIPMRSLLAAGAGIAGGGAHGGTLEGAGAGAALGLLAYALDDPWVKSRLAIAIGRGADALARNPGAVSRVVTPAVAYGTTPNGAQRTQPPPQ